MAFPAPPLLRASASVLALVLICVPLTIGAIWAFPIWDDAWFWLLTKGEGHGRHCGLPGLIDLSWEPSGHSSLRPSPPFGVPRSWRRLFSGQPSV